MKIQCIAGTSLRNLTVFGKETMQRKLRTYRKDSKQGNRTDTGLIVRCTSSVFALFLCGILCGCTRREQLVLETGMSEQENCETAETISQEQGSAVQEQAVSVWEQVAPEQEPVVQAQGSVNIYVHVCGAVKNPGVYEMPVGSRVYEAVEEAGGFTEEADSSYVNQAQQLADGAKLVIPTIEQSKELSVAVGIQDDVSGIGSADSTQDEASDGKININTASEAQLCNIPGIGSTRAAAIVAYRQENGGFTVIEDIMNVNGIKEGTYNKIKDKIKVY